ncbi:MAG: acetamidase/formamidase family protein [Chloroflexi bacterium]|nr:acetamidase/formamidase family protein [Chloroflexota bacterium]
MQTFPRAFIQTHDTSAEWPRFLGEVALGESFIVETERFNAANGPVAITGIRAGDPIAVHVEHIEMVGPFEAPNGGPFFEGLGPPVPLDYRDGYFYYPRHFRLKARPAIGNVAVLPAPDAAVLALSRRSLEPGSHYTDFKGWRRVVNDPRGRHCHQDCPWAGAGAAVHLRAQVDGAGLCLADVHGYLGAGEMAFAGIEVAANVQVRVERSTGWLVDWPLVETEHEIMVCCSSTSTFAPHPALQYVDMVREAYRALREVVAARIGSTIDAANTIVASAIDIRNCALYGLRGFVPDDRAIHDWDIAVAAALPKHIFLH